MEGFSLIQKSGVPYVVMDKYPDVSYRVLAPTTDKPYIKPNAYVGECPLDEELIKELRRFVKEKARRPRQKPNDAPKRDAIKRTRHMGTNYKRLLPFARGADANGGYLKCRSGEYMDLVVENIQAADHIGNPVYSIAHYGRQNGDVMRDPEIVFSMDAEGNRCIPISYRNDYIAKFDEAVKISGESIVFSQSTIRSLDKFLYMWLNNIEAQGFTATK